MRKTKTLSTKILALFIAALMLLPMLAACKKGDGDTTDAPESTQPPSEAVTLDISEYTIIRETDSSDGYKECIKALRKGIEERTGIKLDMTEDFVYDGHGIEPKAKEILVGLTNREESKKYLRELREKDFIVTYENDRVIIIGGNVESTKRAVQYFLDTFVHSDEKSVIVYTNRVDLVKHDYAVGAVTLNGVSLGDYKVIYAADDLLAKYAAENFAAAVLDLVGVRLDVDSDKAAETDRELLVGATNRSASAELAGVTCGKGEYLFSGNGGKIVMLGDGYMVGGGASALLWQHILAGENGKPADVTVAASETPAVFEFSTPRNAILMIGDGMGRNHIEAAKKEGMKVFWADTLPNVGTCKTYSYSVIPLGKAEYTDSAASATALSSGYKTINGYVGMDHLKRARKNVRELAYEKGAKTAVITTDVITGATPAGFTAHCGSRNSTALIQSQIDALVNEGKIDWCQGSVGNALTSKTKEALATISADGSSFFMMLEEAYIDKNSHNNKYPEMISAVNRYNDAIAYVIEFVLMHPDTVLMITADHETGGVIKLNDGSFRFTRTSHSNADVPLFTMGSGTETLTNGVCNNVNIAKFIASVFGESNFGD